MENGYFEPELPAGVRPIVLVPESVGNNKLRHDTVVTCINRGRVAIAEKFDGEDYVIPAGYFKARYDAATHFKRRQVVPGTRDPNEFERFHSFIGILGVDREEDCQPFTDEELERMGEQVEAIDRESMVSASDRSARSMGIRNRAPSRGMTARPQIDASQQANPEAAERAASAFTPPRLSDAERDEAERGGRAPAPTAAKPAGGRGRNLNDVRNKVEAE